MPWRSLATAIPRYGIDRGVVQPLYDGFSIFLMSPIEFLQKPIRWLHLISHYQVTHAGAPGFAFALCTRNAAAQAPEHLDLSSWGVAFLGAEPIHAATLDDFAATFAPYRFRREALYPCYGLAEVTLFAAGGIKAAPPVVRQFEGHALEHHQVESATAGCTSPRTLVGCGRAWRDQKIVVVDPQSGTQCPSDRIGEIWVSGPNVALGYWQRATETQQMFHAYLADTNEGPFLRTGDLGFMLSDGELFVTGRIKDVIIVRGRNHYPSDIERTVEVSHAALRPGNGAAFSIDVEGQEHVVIVQEVERRYLRHPNVAEITGSIRQALAAYHGLQVYNIVLVKPGTLPKTSSGKIQRHLCRSQFLNATLQALDGQPSHRLAEPTQRAARQQEVSNV